MLHATGVRLLLGHLSLLSESGVQSPNYLRHSFLCPTRTDDHQGNQTTIIAFEHDHDMARCCKMYLNHNLNAYRNTNPLIERSLPN